MSLNVWIYASSSICQQSAIPSLITDHFTMVFICSDICDLWDILCQTAYLICKWSCNLLPYDLQRSHRAHSSGFCNRRSSKSDWRVGRRTRRSSWLCVMKVGELAIWWAVLICEYIHYSGNKTPWHPSLKVISNIIYKPSTCCWIMMPMFNYLIQQETLPS